MLVVPVAILLASDRVATVSEAHEILKQTPVVRKAILNYE